MSAFALLAFYLGVAVFGAAWRGQPLWLPRGSLSLRPAVAWALTGLLAVGGFALSFIGVGWQVALVQSVAAVGLSGMMVTLLLSLAPRALFVPALGLSLAAFLG